MKPADVNWELLKKEGIVFKKGGCQPYAIAGMLAFQFPEMSVDKTLEIVKKLHMPAQPGERLNQRNGVPRSLYNPVTGSSLWAELIYKGFGDDLASDVNLRLRNAQIPLNFGFLQNYRFSEIEKMIEQGYTLLPLVHYTDEKRLYSQYHIIALHPLDEEVLAMVDSNRGGDIYPNVMLISDLENKLTMPNQRSLFYHDDQYDRDIYWDMNIPIMMHFHKPEASGDFQIHSMMRNSKRLSN